MSNIPRHSIVVKAFTAALLMTLTPRSLQAAQVVNERLTIVESKGMLFDLFLVASFGADLDIDGNTLAVGVPAFTTAGTGSSSNRGLGVFGYDLITGATEFVPTPIGATIVGGLVGFGSNVVVTTGSNDESFTSLTWASDATTGEEIWRIPGSVQALGGIQTIGDRVLIHSSPSGFSGASDSVALYDLHTGSKLVTYLEGQDARRAISVAADDRVVISSVVDGNTSIGIYDLNTGDWLRDLAVSPNPPSMYARDSGYGGSRSSSPIANVVASGKLTVVGGRHVYDLDTGDLLRDLAWPEGMTTFRDISMDGNLAAISSIDGDGAAYVFDVTTGELLMELARSDGQDLGSGRIVISGTTVALSVGNATTVFLEEHDFARPADAIYVFDVPEPASASVIAMSVFVLLRTRAYRPHRNN